MTNLNAGRCPTSVQPINKHKMLTIRNASNMSNIFHNFKTSIISKLFKIRKKICESQKNEKGRVCWTCNLLSKTYEKFMLDRGWTEPRMRKEVT